LVPKPGDPEKGIYSGCAFIGKEGIPILAYLGVDAGICIATAEDDGLIRWTKSPYNPVIPIPKEGDKDFGRYNVHDPHVWLEGETYYAILNGRVLPDNKWDTTYLFKSTDLNHWDYLHQFYEPRHIWTEPEEDCACPDFFQLGEKHMLLCISHKRGCRYYLGSYREEKFYPEKHVRMNGIGGTMFAPESLLDQRGRRIFWAWILDRRHPDTIASSGWSGVMSLPRTLSLENDGNVRIQPVDEVKKLRLAGFLRQNIDLPAKGEFVIDEVRGDCLELAIEADPWGCNEFGVAVRRSPDGSEQTLIVFDTVSKTLKLDVSCSTLDESICYPTVCVRPPVDDPGEFIQSMPLELERGETLKLRVFLDRSLIEVFANEIQCVTQSIYPTRSDSVGISLFSHGGTARVTSFKAWEIASCNPW